MIGGNMQSTHTTRLGGIAVALSVLTLVACGGGSSGPSTSGATGAWADVVRKANAEGTVSWWSENFNTPNQRAIQAFQTAYPGIKVELTQGLPNVIEPKYAQAVQQNLPGPDVYSSFTPPWIQDVLSRNAVVKPEGPDAAKFPTTGVAYDGYALVLNENATAVVWNTDHVPVGVKAYQDLLDPKLKGHIGIYIANNANITAMWEHVEQQAGAGYLNKLAAQGPFHFYTSSAPLSQAVAAGEVWAAIGTAASAADLTTKGAPIKWAYSAGDRPIAFAQYSLLMKSAAHPNAARVFQNFMATKAGQQAVDGDGLGVSVLPGISGALPPAPNGVTNIDGNKWTPDYTANYLARWSAIFKYTP